MLQQDLDPATGILTLTMARPPVNALNQAMYDAIHEGFAFASQNYDVKSIVFTSKDAKAFSAGADIKEYAHLSREDAEHKQLALLLRCLQDLVNCPKPTMAAVSAPAIGAGLMLACACDEIVLADSAWVSLPEIELALPTPIGAAIVGRRAKLPAVHALLQRAERFDAARCLAEGLADTVVPASDLSQQVRTRLAVYSEFDTDVYATNKRWLNRGLAEQLQAAAQMVSHS